MPRGRPRASSSADDSDAPKVPLVATSFGTVTGKVILDGSPPAEQPVQMGNSEAQCHAGEKPADEVDGPWVVDSNGGVMNAVVFLAPPPGKYFALPDAAKKPPKGEETVRLHQPRCQFIPRVFVLYPSYFDPEANGQKPTGQQFVIANDAPFGHNWSLIPNSDENTARGDIIKPGSTEVFRPLNPQIKPIFFQCNIHSWMRAYGFVLDSPYSAVTKKDGSFKIENVPLGVELRVVAWHEATGFFNGGEDGTKATLSANEELKLPKLRPR